MTSTQAGDSTGRIPGPVVWGPPGESWTLVRASGDIDVATAPELDRALLAAVTPDLTLTGLVP